MGNRFGCPLLTSAASNYASSWLFLRSSTRHSLFFIDIKHTHTHTHLKSRIFSLRLTLSLSSSPDALSLSLSRSLSLNFPQIIFLTSPMGYHYHDSFEVTVHCGDDITRPTKLGKWDLVDLAEGRGERRDEECHGEIEERERDPHDVIFSPRSHIPIK